MSSNAIRYELALSLQAGLSATKDYIPANRKYMGLPVAATQKLEPIELIEGFYFHISLLASKYVDIVSKVRKY